MSDYLDKIRKRQAQMGNGPLKPGKAPRTAATPHAEKKAVPPPRKKPRKRKPYPLSPEERDRRAEVKGRLPDGAKYEKVYDAERQVWKGSLTLYRLGLAYYHARHEAAGSFQLEHELDNMYRGWLAEQANTKPADPMRESPDQEEAGPGYVNQDPA
jgi:hypothetical protein